MSTESKIRHGLEFGPDFRKKYYLATQNKGIYVIMINSDDSNSTV